MKVFSTPVAAWKPAMNFYFCETCGKRLTDIDLADGRARDKQVKGIYCKACAESVVTMEFEAIKLPITDQTAAAPRKKTTSGINTAVPARKKESGINTAVP